MAQAGSGTWMFSVLLSASSQHLSLLHGSGSAIPSQGSSTTAAVVLNKVCLVIWIFATGSVTKEPLTMTLQVSVPVSMVINGLSSVAEAEKEKLMTGEIPPTVHGRQICVTANVLVPGIDTGESSAEVNTRRNCLLTPHPNTRPFRMTVNLATQQPAF